MSPRCYDLSAIIECFTQMFQYPALSLCQLLQPGCIGPLRISALMGCKSPTPPTLLPLANYGQQSCLISKKRDLVVPEANRIRVVPYHPNRMEVVVHTECEQFSVSQACYHNSLVNTDGRLPEKSSGLNTETA